MPIDACLQFFLCAGIKDASIRDVYIYIEYFCNETSILLNEELKLGVGFSSFT